MGVQIEVTDTCQGRMEMHILFGLADLRRGAVQTANGKRWIKVQY